MGLIPVPLGTLLLLACANRPAGGEPASTQSQQATGPADAAREPVSKQTRCEKTRELYHAIAERRGRQAVEGAPAAYRDGLAAQAQRELQQLDQGFVGLCLTLDDTQIACFEDEKQLTTSECRDTWHQVGAVLHK